MNNDQKPDVEKKDASCCCGANKGSCDDKGEEREVLHTFDMYHFFSRKDVLFAIGFIVTLLLILAFKALFAPSLV